MPVVDRDRQRLHDAVDDLIRTFPPASTGTEEFLAAQYDAGLAWVHFPIGRGGLEVPRSLQSEVSERLASEGAPNAELRNAMGYHIAAPTILAGGPTSSRSAICRRSFAAPSTGVSCFPNPGLARMPPQYPPAPSGTAATGS